MMLYALLMLTKTKYRRKKSEYIHEAAKSAQKIDDVKNSSIIYKQKI